MSIFAIRLLDPLFSLVSSSSRLSTESQYVAWFFTVVTSSGISQNCPTSDPWSADIWTFIESTSTSSKT